MDQATPDEVSERRQRSRSFGACMKLTPWFPFLSIVLFVGGLVTWAIYANRTKNNTIQFADAIGADPNTTDRLENTTFDIILSVTIAGGALMAVVLLMALIRTAQRSMLWGGCCCMSDRPQPWWYTTFAVINGMLAIIMWLMLLASVVLLMTTLLWFGGSWAVRDAILDGTSSSGALAASDSAASVVDGLRTLAANRPTCAAGTPWAAAVDESLAALVGGTSTNTSTPFQVLCPASCLNLGSFATLLNLNSSCLCGSATLSLILSIANNARQSSAIALGGAAAMFVACTLLLMMLTSHGTTAAYDRRTAKAFEKRREEEYERGFKASPSDLHYPSAPRPAPVMMHTAHNAV